MNNGLNYTFIFGGGAVRGISYIGVIKALRELNVTADAIAGSSVGAIFAVLYSLGFTTEELQEIMFEFSFNKFKDINLNFGPNFAFSKGQVFLDWLRELIEQKVYGEKYEKGKNPPVKFIDIDKDLYILTCDLMNNSPFVFSKNNTPEFEIAMAVRISASFPGLMNPSEYKDTILIDGDLVKSWPLWKTDRFLTESTSRILEFRLEGYKESGTIKNPLDYFNMVFSAFSNFCTENVINCYGENDKYDYILIDTKDVLLIDFALEEQKRLELMSTGYETTINYFKKDLIKKKKQLLPCYYKLLNNLLDTHSLLLKNKIPEAQNKLFKTMSDLNDCRQYIDSSFLKNIAEFKDRFISDIKKTYIFNTYKLNNATNHSKSLLGIVDSLSDKCNELNNYIDNYGNAKFK